MRMTKAAAQKLFDNSLDELFGSQFDRMDDTQAAEMFVEAVCISSKHEDAVGAVAMLLATYARSVLRKAQGNAE
jgi:hypothetical protein